MKVSLSKDLSTLTTIKEVYIDKLLEKVNYCVSAAVDNARVANDSTIEIDIGFGCITILIGESDIKYKFKPSPQLEKTIVDTIINEQSILDDAVEKALVSKITNIYKDMF